MQLVSSVNQGGPETFGPLYFSAAAKVRRLGENGKRGSCVHVVAPINLRRTVNAVSVAALRDCAVVEVAPAARLKALSSAHNCSKNRRA